MAKAKFQTAQTVNYEPASIRDLGYKQAVIGDTTESLAKWAKKTIPTLPESISDEAKAELYSGYILRFTENNPDVEYAVIGGNYLPVDSLQDVPEKAERIMVGASFAMSFTQQAFGALNNDKSASYNPKLHSIIKALREQISKYCSNRLGVLKAEIKRLDNKDSGKTRAQALEFADFINKTFDTMQTRCKTAKTQRGDETANLDLFIAAKAAFFAKWNAAK